MDTQLNTEEDIKSSLTRYYGNHYMMQLIGAYARRHPGKIVRIGEFADPAT
ncbi:MAG: hypothetical protein KL787_03865 [Taibaiella sp.]|nr:hypothetical protein [Taibaiella sp.]